MASNIANGNGHSPVTDPLLKDAAQGAVVHTFDPDAPPEAKASAAGKARDKLKPLKDSEGPGEREVQIDRGGSGVIPTIKIEDTDANDADTADKPDVSEAPRDEGPPGALPDGLAPAIPDWYIVGWRQMARIDAPPLQEGEEKDKGILDAFISEQFYGAWYHNAALIVFAVFASHFLTRFGFGWGWLFILLAVCSTYYSTSMERVRRNSRDDIQRELVKTRLASEHESADWINNFLDRFWLIYEPVLSTTIVSSVDQVLSSNTPAFLDSLRLSEFTLGTKAPRIDRVRTFPKTPDDIIMMDWGISFTPNDTSEMTLKQASAKVNPRIVLSVRLGKGLATAAMPILLEDITFSGLMRIRMKLMSNFPHVQVVDICFLEKPVIDYVLKPIGGDTFGVDIANVPGLSSFIRDMTHATLGPMMYDPNVFTLNLEQLLSGTPLDAAIGVLQITVHSARGIKGVKIGGGTPDPFVGICFNGRAEVARTKYKNNTYNPTWSETKFVLVNSLTETLNFNVWDYNDHRKNSLLGTSSFELSVLAEDATQENIATPILKDGKERGELRYDVSYYPVLKAEEGQEESPETNAGIVRLIVHQAKELDASKSMSGDLNPLAKVFVGNNAKPTHTTNTTKHTNNPVWESAHEFLCADRKSSVITVKVIDDRDFLKDPVVGYMSISLDDLLSSKKDHGRDWFPLSGCKSGKLRLSAEWKPLDLAGSLHGADQYTPPIGVVRLWLDRATDVKNVEAALGGKSDPYMRVQVNNDTKGRTEVINNNLNPVWDQIIYIPVHSLKETMLLECMDYQHITRDRSLGSIELRVADLARESDDATYPFASLGVKTAVDPFHLDKGQGYKGSLHYTAEFVPAMKLKGIKFDKTPNELEDKTAEPNSDDAGNVVESDGTSMSSSDEEHQAIPEGVTFQLQKKGHTKNVKSTDTSRTAESTVDTVATAETNGSNGAGSVASTTETREEGVEMTHEELLTHQSGVIIFDVVSGQLPKKARLEVLMDDGYWPCFSTGKARSANAAWEYVGEGFVKELDFGQVWLRLNDAEEDEKDDIISQWKGDTKGFLQSCLTGQQHFTLRDQDDRPAGVVTLQARYVPVPVKLEARESVNNQGVLRADLISGHGIRAADRGGKSDPYAVFSLNGQKVFKSQTKKKTLNPEWNDSFTTQVPSRVGADFYVEVFDWNQIEQAKSLGSAQIDLSTLEPFEAAELQLPLTSPKHGEHGHVKVRLMFQPEIIAKARKNTSTFSSAGRAMTQIGGLPVSAGKGVLQGVTGIFKKDKDDDDDVSVKDVPAGQASVPVGGDYMTGGSAFPSLPNKPSLEGISASGGHAPLGTLRVTVLEAKDLSSGDCKPYAIIRVGDKEHKTKHVGKTASPEWNESFTCGAGPVTNKLHAWIHDHKTLGKDKLLGEGEVDIWRHIQPQGISAAEVLTELRQGNGLLKLRLEYDAGTPFSGSGRASSISSSEGIMRTKTIISPSRFSLSRRRDADSDD